MFLVSMFHVSMASPFLSFYVSMATPFLSFYGYTVSKFLIVSRLFKVQSLMFNV